MFLGRGEEVKATLLEQREHWMKSDAHDAELKLDEVENRLVNQFGYRELSRRLNLSTNDLNEEYVVNDQLKLRAFKQIDGFEFGSTWTDIAESGKMFATGNCGAGTVWSRDGDVLFEADFLNTSGRKNSYVGVKFFEPLGLVKFKRSFYDLKSFEEKFKLEHELLDSKKKPSNPAWICLPKSKQIVSFLSDEVAVFDASGKLVQQFALEGWRLAVLPKSGNMVVWKDGHVHLIDFKNKKQSKFNKFKLTPQGDSLAISDDERYLFLAGYGPMQQWVDLETGKFKTVRCHPTHEKGYKKSYTSHHNFGCNTARFNSDASVLATSADHGRNTLFKLPKFDRVDIQTRENFDYAWESSFGPSFTLRSPVFIGDLLMAEFGTRANGGLTFWNLDGELVKKIEGVTLKAYQPESGLMLWCVGRTKTEPGVLKVVEFQSTTS